MQIVDDYYSGVELTPGRLATDGTVSSGRPTASQLPGVFTGIWEAPPGTYEHPGWAGGEVFFVTEGTAKYVIEGLGEFDVRPGSIVTMPPNTASKLVVFTLLRKFALVPGRVQG